MALSNTRAILEKNTRLRAIPFGAVEFQIGSDGKPAKKYQTQPREVCDL